MVVKPRIRCHRVLLAAVIAASILGGIGPVAAAGPIGARLSAADAAGAPPATAPSRFPLDSQAMLQARAIAVKYWGTSPCAGAVSTIWAPLDPAVNAVSDWTTSADENVAENNDCVITLNQVDAFDWPMLCTVVVHEMGHLAGQQHSTDRRSVMYPVYVAPVSECRNASAATATATTRSARAVATRRTSRKHKKHHSKRPSARR